MMFSNMPYQAGELRHLSSWGTAIPEMAVWLWVGLDIMPMHEVGLDLFDFQAITACAPLTRNL